MKRNLDGPKKDKRNFIYISNELTIDKTLQPLRADKYRDNFMGIDISEGAIKDSTLNPFEYFNYEHDKEYDNVIVPDARLGLFEFVHP